MVLPVAGLIASNGCPLSGAFPLPSTNIFRTELATSTVMSPLQFLLGRRLLGAVATQLKGLRVDASVLRGIDVPWVPDRLRVGERLVGEHGDLVLSEAQLLHARDLHVDGQLVDVLHRHLRRAPQSDTPRVEPESDSHPRKALGFAGVVVLHHGSEEARCQGAMWGVVDATGSLAHRVRRSGRVGAV